MIPSSSTVRRSERNKATTFNAPSNENSLANSSNVDSDKDVKISGATKRKKADDENQENIPQTKKFQSSENTAKKSSNSKESGKSKVAEKKIAQSKTSKMSEDVNGKNSLNLEKETDSESKPKEHIIAPKAEKLNTKNVTSEAPTSLASKATNEIASIINSNDVRISIEHWYFVVL